MEVSREAIAILLLKGQGLRESFRGPLTNASPAASSENLLEEKINFECADPRDRIFALLSLLVRAAERLGSSQITAKLSQM